MASPERRRSPTMADVAAHAGVSHQTVSRVLNGMPGVGRTPRSGSTRRISELGYRRNMAAKMLASSRSRTIGVLTWGTSQFGPAQVLLGLEAAAREADYRLTPVTVTEMDPSGVRLAIDELLEHGPRGGDRGRPAPDRAADRPGDRPRHPHGRRRGRPLADAAHGRRRQRAGCPARHAAPAGPRPRHGGPPRGAAGLERGRGPDRGLARRADRGVAAVPRAALGRRLVARRAATRRAAPWPGSRTSRRSSPATTRWRSA